MSSSILKLNDKWAIETDRLAQLILLPSDLAIFADLMELSREKVIEIAKLLFDDDTLEQFESEHFSRTLQSVGGYSLHGHQVIQRMAHNSPEKGDRELLLEFFKYNMQETVQSIREVGAALHRTMTAFAPRDAKVIFDYLPQLRLNTPHPTFGTFKGQLEALYRGRNAVVFDVSGSVSESTVRTLAEPVVTMSQQLEADLMLVSTNAYLLPSGQYDVNTVLSTAEYGGTNYATLAPYFEGTYYDSVIGIADYDSYYEARSVFTTRAIGTYYDVSLVERPTFLSECLGRISDNIQYISVLGN